MGDDYGDAWARGKLDMPRRKRELAAYVERWLPELKTATPGLVIDVGCGPGDLLAMARNMGHDVLGIDAPVGRGGMGEAYQKLATEYCRSFKVDVDRRGLLGFLENGGPAMHAERCAAINARGSIEQALACCMIGDPHDEHHDAKRLDWNRDEGPLKLDSFMEAAHKMLRPGGLLLIAANGSRTGDAWYDNTIRIAAESYGLELVDQEGLLVHKWVKP